MQASSRDSAKEFGNLKSFLNDQSKKNQRLLIITFVHGWKHNASTDDAHVRLFRQVLENTAALEEEAGTHRRVVGVYLGWRGDSLNVPDGLKSVLTFYDRKGTADKVSKGAIHEVVAYLNAYEKRENNVPGRKCDRVEASMGCQVVSVLIGHSFGGLILYEAIAPAVLSSIIDGEVDGGEKGPSHVERFDDMVLLINQAIEAVRFQPLFRSVATYKPKQYRAALMVMVTTGADVATGTFFRSAGSSVLSWKKRMARSSMTLRSRPSDT
ncbi:alpha/beta hydrolase [Caballeronia sp. LZ019]|uniref:alpha/beta hydrolase n=1 Tax=Caballeronia sp. LZ019 TaxID=3038555 RepID=UPI00285F6E72|nr:alpha/beta hydrolase [Caballeronia sp. LZ019]MDR5809076.1 alpha/beta hydrolase [Caballeronia sp. LZ019]